MPAFALGFGLLEILIFSVLLIAMIVSASLDRSFDKTSPKWWVVTITIFGCAIWFWKDWSFSGVFSTLTSLDFWKPALVYLGIGLIYSVLEFALAVRRAARDYSKKWIEWSKNKSGSISSFMLQYNGSVSPLISVKIINENDIAKLEPKIDRSELSASIGAWTFFWPAYLISLVIGDLFVEIINAISRGFIFASDRFVKMAFKDTFNKI